MMDLSKFLTPSDDDENENEEKLYDTVENVRQQVEEHLKKEQEPNIPSTSGQIDADPETDIPCTSGQIDADPETESWDDDEDDDLLPLPDEDQNKSKHDYLSKQELTSSEAFDLKNQSSRTTSPLTISAKEETVCPTLNEGLITKVKSPLKSPLKTLNKGNPSPFVETQNFRSRLESTMTHDSLENRSTTTPPLTDSAKEAADDDLNIVEKTDPFLKNKVRNIWFLSPLVLSK